MLKIIEDLCSAIAGNAKTRINDPFIGTFICSWIVCNWNNLALLFWGEGKAGERISAFYIYLSYTPFWEFNRLFFVPLVIALFYLFAFPWISFVIKFAQHWANELLHKQAVDSEKLKIDQQVELNKAKLKANQDKPFLEQLVQQDVDERAKLIQQKIDKKNSVLEHLKLRTERLEAKAKEARDKAKKQEDEKKLIQEKLKIKEQQAERDKINFEKDKATLSSLRFPAVYNLMREIAASLEEEGIHLSFSAYGGILAALFGYESFEHLVNDERFNNKTLEEVKYIFYDDQFAKRLEQVILNEGENDKNVSSEVIFNYLIDIYSGIPSDSSFRLVSERSLGEISSQFITDDPPDVRDSSGIYGDMSDIIYDSINFELPDYHIEKDSFFITFDGYVDGTFYEEDGRPGNGLNVTLTMTCDILLGQYALGNIHYDGISGQIKNFNDAHFQ